MKVLFRGVVFLIICVSLLVIFGDNVMKSDYVQKNFFPNDYWPPKVQGISDQIVNLRSKIYQTELDIEEAKLLGKYAIIEAQDNTSENTAVNPAESHENNIQALQQQLAAYNQELKETQELLKFASQFSKDSKDKTVFERIFSLE